MSFEFLRKLGNAITKDFHSDPSIKLDGDVSNEDHDYHVTKIPDGWRFIDHKHVNNGEGYSAEPYDVDVYVDLQGKTHEVFGTFSIDDAKA